jgi:hypothetical protein
VKFKNELERRIFDIAQAVCGDKASIEHNKTLQIEIANSLEVASFVGPPKKEIDVITTGFESSPDLKLLISCKDYTNSKAEPADVQEWAAVVGTMNRYSGVSHYLGLVLCPVGFTNGCEPWASSYNLGVIPPLKGKRLIFPTTVCVEMFERVLKALSRRLHFSHENLFRAPEFYDFIYRLTEPFEDRDQSVKDSRERYKLLGKGWVSSFQELVKTFMGKTVLGIASTTTGLYIAFSNDLSFRMIGKQIQFGPNDDIIGGQQIIVKCEKNYFGEPCEMGFLTKLVTGQKVTSAGDWDDRFEFGLTDDLIMAVEPERLQVYRTRNPMENNLL